MKIALDGVEYDLAEALSKAHLGLLMELKVKTKTDDFPGVTPKAIKDALATMAATFRAVEDDAAAGDAMLEMLGDEGFLRGFIALVFLARRRNGELVTFAEAGEFSFNEIEWVVEEVEPENPDVPFTDPVDAPPPELTSTWESSTT